MKAMILAAGLGVRMQPLTLTTPKPLLKVRGQALIDYHIEALRAVNIFEIAINVHHLGDQIIAHFNQPKFKDLHIQFFNEPEILGTGGGVFQALSFLGEGPFIVLSADIFTDYPLEQLPKSLNGCLAHLVMVDNPVFHPKGDFYLMPNGLLSLKSGVPLTYGNIGVFSAPLFAHYSKQKFEMREVLDMAIALQKISAEHYQGAWENIGTVAQLERLTAYK